MSQIVEKADSTGNQRGRRSSAQILTEIYQPIASELVAVEQLLMDQLSSGSVLVEELLSHSRLLSGKRIRPAFLLLTAACCSSIDERHLKMAAALEMIHTATLIHDDVLDGAETRRHEPTANAKWGNKSSVLLGDYLFTNSFHLAAQSESAGALAILAQASNKVCSGEIRQNELIGQYDLTEEQYFQIISDKTAELCAVGCRLGAFLSGAEQVVADLFEDYGRNIGIAFQIIDDVLDVVGKSDEVGKTLATDLQNRKATLPIIHCLRSLETEASTRLRGELNKSPVNVDTVRKYLGQTNSIQYARNAAADHAKRAIEFARSLPHNPYSNSLICLADFVLKRSS